MFGMQSIAILELQKLGKNALVKLSVEAMRDISFKLADGPENLRNVLTFGEKYGLGRFVICRLSRF